MNEILCYCCSGKVFTQCCEPILKGEINAPTALTLMRSRYSAFATANGTYLAKTAHASLKKDFQIKETENWAKEQEWNKLEIISTTLGGEKHERGEVEFKAFYTDPKGDQLVIHENSFFIKENNQWIYWKGNQNPKTIKEEGKTGRNDPCPCGSGLKYKKCCA